MGNKWRVWAGILAVFLCGVIIGGVGGRLLVRQWAMHHFAEIQASKGAILADRALERLGEKLDLTERQNDQIKPLLMEAYREGHAHIMQTRKDIVGILKDTLANIRPHLSEEQAQILKSPKSFRILLPRVPPGGPPLPVPDEDSGAKP